MKRTLVCLFFIGLFCSIVPVVFAQECTDENINKVATTTDQDFLSRLGAKCEQRIADMEKAVAPHKDELTRLDRAIDAFQTRIKGIETDVAQKTIRITEGEKELGGLFELASRRIRQFYIRSFANNMITLFFSSENIGSAFRTIGYQQAAVNEDKKVITQTASIVKNLEDKKHALEQERIMLAQLKADTDRRAEAIRKLVGDALAYESKVQGYIAAITARQQDFLAAKLAGLGIPLYAISGGGCSSDINPYKDPGFSGTKFGLFSYGVPNRVGLNQYGAWGRAKAGQSYETILRAYYTYDSIEQRSASINVQGYSSYSLDAYTKRIYEVPDSWTENDLAALKAQAIAVRSYALAYTNNGQGSICTTQQCQVFKPDEKGGNWNQAVDATAGLVMIKDGQPIKAFFSSTHGGFAFNTGDLTGWTYTPYTKRMVDTPNGSVSGFDDLKNNAYDKDSPWFYCDWGARSAYNGTAWLKSDEVADIVNVILLARRDGSTQKHLVQTDKPNPDGVETWDAGRVRSELSSRGGIPYTSVSDISVNFNTGSGQTTGVVVSGDGGTNTFDGGDFKTYFNLRAPANIQIVGPLYNVEKR